MSAGLAQDAQRFAFPQLHASDNNAEAGGTEVDTRTPEEIALANAQARELETARTLAMAEGQSAGYAAGLCLGRADAAAQVQAECEARRVAVQRIESTLAGVVHALDAQVGAAVVRLVAALVVRIVNVELHTNAAVIAGLVDTALAQLREGVGALTLALHPEDHALLAAGGSDSPPTAVVMRESLHTRIDLSLGRGDVRLETGHGLVEVSLRARLDAAVALLSEGPP